MKESPNFFVQCQREPSEAVVFVIEEYHEPTNERRAGYWEEVARVKWADMHTLPGIWDKLPGRKRLVSDRREVLATEDFGQKFEIAIE